MDRGDQDEEVGIGFVGFGLTSKKFYLKNQGQAVLRKKNNYG